MSIATITRIAAPAIDTDRDRSEIASEEGFTGTLSAFLEWLKDSLTYGFVLIHEEGLNRFGNPVIRVETVTGGYSSDEHLLGRVSRSVFVQANWHSSHRGGLVIYEFPTDWVTSENELTWLEPENDVFETIHRARRVRVYTENGDYVELNYDGAAELVFQEPDRDVNEPDGLLIVRPAH